MKDYFKILLPRKVLKGVALTLKSFKIKSKVPYIRFKRLTIIFLLAGYLLGYYPVTSFPPVKKSVAVAQDMEIKQEIIASSFKEPVQLPHPGYLSTRFSNYHPGVDIAIGLGMPVHPIVSGIIDEVNFSIFGYGNHVIINHDNGFKSLYGHLGRVYVKKGERVTAGKIIGDVGLTGRTSGPHTHLEVTKEGQYINPMTILPQITDMPASASASRI